MELIYRGIKYQNDSTEFHQLIKNNHLPIIYCKKRIRNITKNRFPVTKYCQQLFSKKKSFVLSPVKFHYEHQIQLLENCWRIDMIIILNFCWQATIIMEMERNLRNDARTKLKYRGVSYYKPKMN